MKYWIRPFEPDDGEDAREVTVVDEDGNVVARGGLQVDYVEGATGEVSFGVRFVGIAVER